MFPAKVVGHLFQRNVLIVLHLHCHSPIIVTSFFCKSLHEAVFRNEFSACKAAEEAMSRISFTSLCNILAMQLLKKEINLKKLK